MMNRVPTFAALTLLTLVGTPLGAQEADPADVSSIDGIVAAVYDVIFNDGTRWWVVSIMWDSERPGNPIPTRYIG
jgi:hypothetical protein